MGIGSIVNWQYGFKQHAFVVTNSQRISHLKHKAERNAHQLIDGFGAALIFPYVLIRLTLRFWPFTCDFSKIS